MHKLSNIGSLLKKIYRGYSSELLSSLQDRGFLDLRPSFLEVLIFICHESGPTIKKVGDACALKKQTMTSHLNELERRGFIIRKVSDDDKRAIRIFLTEYGEKFKLNLFEAISLLEEKYLNILGEVEFDRIYHVLSYFHERVIKDRTM